MCALFELGHLHFELLWLTLVRPGDMTTQLPLFIENSWAQTTLKLPFFRFRASIFIRLFEGLWFHCTFNLLSDWPFDPCHSLCRIARSRACRSVGWSTYVAGHDIGGLDLYLVWLRVLARGLIFLTAKWKGLLKFEDFVKITKIILVLDYIRFITRFLLQDQR